MIPLFKVYNNVEEAAQNVRSVLESGYVGQGPWCNQLEEKFSELIGRRALYVNSGTSAIQLALHMAGVGPETEVITTPITCIATNAAIVALGGRIVWADVDPLTGNIDIEDVVKKVTSRTRAIIGVDWGGRRCEFSALRKFTRGITLIEDAAHALSKVDHNSGDYICYSLQAIKSLNTADGGMLSCPSSATHERAKLLRWFGLDRTRSDSMRCYQPINEVGWKMQGNDVLASIGCANITSAKSIVDKHRDNARYLHRELQGVQNIGIPPWDEDSAYWLFTIHVSSPALFESFMAEEGVAVSQVHARNDIYGCFKEFAPKHLPGVELFSAHQCSIPVGWWLSDEDVKCVLRSVKKWAETTQARWNQT